MSSITACQCPKTNNTNACHRGASVVKGQLREGFQDMKNRNGGRSEDSDSIQYILARKKEIRQG